MNIGGRRTSIEEAPPRHVHVVEGIAWWHEALVANEPMHAVPRDPVAVSIRREQLVKLLRARAAGQAYRDATAIGFHSCEQAIRGRLRQRRLIGDRDDMAIVVRNHPLTGLRQLRPSRLNSALAASGPSLPAL